MEEIKLNCFLIILTLLYILGLIAYVIIGIIYLINYYEDTKDCNGSNLWEYVLVSVIIPCLGILSSKNNSTESNRDIYLIIFVLSCIIDYGLAIWGGIEIFNNSCSNIKNTKIWDFSLASFCLQLIWGTMFLILSIIINIFSSPSLRDEDKVNLDNVNDIQERFRRIHSLANNNTKQLITQTDIDVKLDNTEKI